MLDWKQCALDAEGILCDAGDLFRKCYAELIACDRTDLAEEVCMFCRKVHNCMESGMPWSKHQPPESGGFHAGVNEFEELIIE